LHIVSFSEFTTLTIVEPGSELHVDRFGAWFGIIFTLVFTRQSLLVCWLSVG